MEILEQGVAQGSTVAIMPGGSTVGLEATDTLTKYEILVARAVEVFGDEVKASIWLSSPTSDLHGRTPLEEAQRNGYRVDCLESLFTHIEHGIY